MNLLTILSLSLISLLQSREPVNFMFVGDAMQHGPQLTAARQADGSYDYSSCFSYIEDDIRWADCAVVNLECPLGGPPYTGYPAFSAPDSYAAQLKASGFDIVLTANNHCMDRGANGARRTCQVLDSLDIPHLGTWRDAAERRQRLPMVTEVKGMRIGWLDYTYGTNGIPVTGGVVVDHIDRQLIKADIDATRAAGAQVLCVCLHWGVEYMLKPVESQRSLADWLVDQGVDLIIGGHPHVVEPMEVRHSARHDKDVLLVYSLGNFISNQNDIDSRGGAMVKVSVALFDGKPVVQDARYKLFYVQKPSYRGENYKVIPENRRDLVRAGSLAEFDRFMQRTHSLVTKFNVNVPQEQ